MTFLAQKGPRLQKRNELSNEIYFKELVLNKGLVKAECFVNLSAGEHSVPEFPLSWMYGTVVPCLIEYY